LLPFFDALFLFAMIPTARARQHLSRRLPLRSLCPRPSVHTGPALPFGRRDDSAPFHGGLWSSCEQTTESPWNGSIHVGLEKADVTHGDSVVAIALSRSGNRATELDNETAPRSTLPDDGKPDVSPGAADESQFVAGAISVDVEVAPGTERIHWGKDFRPGDLRVLPSISR
jgi:hypothetical protein